MEEQAIYRAFGRAVAERRRAIGKTQEQVAKAIGLSRASLANIERGSQKVFLHQVMALSRALGLQSAHEIVPSQIFPPGSPTKTGFKLSGATDLSRHQKEFVTTLVSAFSPPGESDR